MDKQMDEEDLSEYRMEFIWLLAISVLNVLTFSFVLGFAVRNIVMYLIHRGRWQKHYLKMMYIYTVTVCCSRILDSLFGIYYWSRVLGADMWFNDFSFFVLFEMYWTNFPALYAGVLIGVIQVFVMSELAVSIYFSVLQISFREYQDKIK